MIVRGNAIRGTVCRGNVRRVTVLETNVAAYWKNGDIEAFVKKLSQRPANNIDIGGRGTDLRIYVRYYRHSGTLSYLRCSTFRRFYDSSPHY